MGKPFKTKKGRAVRRMSRQLAKHGESLRVAGENGVGKESEASRLKIPVQGLGEFGAQGQELE
jgi:hypothetical protein